MDNQAVTYFVLDIVMCVHSVCPASVMVNTMVNASNCAGHYSTEGLRGSHRAKV